MVQDILNDENKISSDFYFITRAYNWFQSVIYQGERTIRIAQQDCLTSTMDSTEIFEMMERLNKTRYIQFMEEHFFLIALGKSVDFLYMYNEYSEILATIDEKVGIANIRDIRNMREHDDEYLLGKGHKKDKFIYNDMERSSISDATSTSIDFNTKEYLLGGRVDVVATVKLYKELLTKVFQIKEEYIENLFAFEKNLSNENL